MYGMYNMRGYILLYEKEANRIKAEILAQNKAVDLEKFEYAQSKAVDLEKFEYAGSYRRWASKNNLSIRQAGRYFACMRGLGFMIKHNKKNYLARERPSEATIKEDCLPPFLRRSTKNNKEK